MSHTSQRRGLDPQNPGREMIVLAMVPAKHKDDPGVGRAMSELALKMLEHRPINWMSKNFPGLDVPDLGPLQGPIRSLHEAWPRATEKLLMRGVGYMSSVVTALYNNIGSVSALIADLQGEWLTRNREENIPISIVLSALFDDTHQVCARAGLTEYTYLHSLGFYGKVEDLPSPEELEIATMCGHGLISIHLIRDRADQIRRGAMTPREAADEVAKPCVCGIVNPERAEEIFTRLAR